MCFRFLLRITKTGENLDELDLAVEPDFDVQVNMSIKQCWNLEMMNFLCETFPPPTF